MEVYIIGMLRTVNQPKMVELSTVSGASDVPTTVVRKVMVSDTDRHVLCFGANPVGSATFDPLLIRWSSQESNRLDTHSYKYRWDIRLSQGSRLSQLFEQHVRSLCLQKTVYTVCEVYPGFPPFTFGAPIIGTNVRTDTKTAIAVNDVVLWMGQETSIFTMVV